MSNPESRAVYDIKYQTCWNSKWIVVSEVGTRNTFDDDWKTRETLLSLLYVQLRRNKNKPGLGEYEVACLLNKPMELIEFHV